MAKAEESTAGEAVAAGDEQIVSLIPAEAGWRAIYGGDQGGEESGLSRVVAWALVEAPDGGRRVVGLVVNPRQRTAIIPADGTESAASGKLTGYGFKEA